MAIYFAQMIGGFIRWLFKKCKTNLSDEIHGRFDGKWLKSYDTENYIIGLFSTIIFLGISRYCFAYIF